MSKFVKAMAVVKLKNDRTAALYKRIINYSSGYSDALTVIC